MRTQYKDKSNLFPALSVDNAPSPHRGRIVNQAKALYILLAHATNLACTWQRVITR